MILHHFVKQQKPCTNTHHLHLIIAQITPMTQYSNESTAFHNAIMQFIFPALPYTDAKYSAVLRCAICTDKKARKNSANLKFPYAWNNEPFGVYFLIRRLGTREKGFHFGWHGENNLHSFLVLGDCILENCILHFYDPTFIFHMRLWFMNHERTICLGGHKKLYDGTSPRFPLQIKQKVDQTSETRKHRVLFNI